MLVLGSSTLLYIAPEKAHGNSLPHGFDGPFWLDTTTGDVAGRTGFVPAALHALNSRHQLVHRYLSVPRRGLRTLVTQ
jgi:hypothetical protein